MTRHPEVITGPVTSEPDFELGYAPIRRFGHYSHGDRHGRIVPALLLVAVSQWITAALCNRRMNRRMKCAKRAIEPQVILLRGDNREVDSLGNVVSDY
jgi:hypothetical protein